MGDFDLTRAKFACVELLTRFVGHLDRCEYDALLDLVTPDCVWRGVQDAHGKEAIRARLASRATEIDTLHLLSNIVVTMLDEGSATATSYLIVYRLAKRTGSSAPPGTAVPHTIGIVHDRLALGAGGWLLAQRDLTILAQAAAV